MHCPGDTICVSDRYFRGGTNILWCVCLFLSIISLYDSKLEFLSTSRILISIDSSTDFTFFWNNIRHLLFMLVYCTCRFGIITIPLKVEGDSLSFEIANDTSIMPQQSGRRAWAQSTSDRKKSLLVDQWYLCHLSFRRFRRRYYCIPSRGLDLLQIRARTRHIANISGGTLGLFRKLTKRSPNGIFNHFVYRRKKVTKSRKS